MDSVVSDVFEFLSIYPWFFSRIRRVEGQSSRRIRYFVDFTGRHDIINTRSTGLQQDFCRAVELEEKLVTCTVSSGREDDWRGGPYSVSPDSHSRPCANLVQYVHCCLPCV